MRNGKGIVSVGYATAAADAISPTKLCDKTMRIEYTEYNVFHSDDVNGSKQKHSGDIKPYLRRLHFPSRVDMPFMCSEKESARFSL